MAGRAPPPHDGGGHSEPQSTELVLSGFKGNFSVINGPYAPLAQQHKSHLAWRHRDPAGLSCAIFHTGKNRWVVSRDLDDGATCFAFLQDTNGSQAPCDCPQVWSFYDMQTEGWQQDPSIRCTARAVTSDPFTRLFSQVEADLDKVGVMDQKKRAQLWKRCDTSGDGFCDLMEIEALIKEMTRSKVWPDFLNVDDDVIKRAFNSTLESSLDGDTQIDKDEFHSLLSNLFWFAKLHTVYTESASQGTSMDVRGFRSLMNKLGVTMTEQEVTTVWREVDSNQSGDVDFDEFCNYLRRKVCGEGEVHQSDASIHAQNTHDQMEKAGGGATMGSMVKQKNFEDFDKLEAQIKAMCAEQSGKGVKRLWSLVDKNGNGYVSLAEFQGMISERYPLLNHAPALMRAFQASKNKDGKQTGHAADYITRGEFKLLICNTFYFNKLFWLFDQADQGHDRRMDFPEFQWCLTMVGIKMSQASAKTEFEKVDGNRGGQILFDEFCKYIVNKKCPEGLTQYLS